jgi:hypothetical protein
MQFEGFYEQVSAMTKDSRSCARKNPGMKGNVGCWFM